MRQVTRHTEAHTAATTWKGVDYSDGSADTDGVYGIAAISRSVVLEAVAKLRAPILSDILECRFRHLVV